MRFRLLTLVLTSLVLAGCGGRQTLPEANAGGSPGKPASHIAPFVRQTGEQPVQWRRFGDAASVNYPQIISGPDGNIWFTDYSNRRLTRMKMTGSVHSIPLDVYPSTVAVGSDGNFYVGSDNNSTIDVVTPGGVVTPYSIPSGDFVSEDSMTKGPDGNVWFAENAHVGKISTAGVITEYPYADGDTQNYYGTVISGPDSNIWVTQYFNKEIDKVNPSTGAMTAFAIFGCNPSSLISAVGSMWVNCQNSLAKVTTSGASTLFGTGFTIGQSGASLALGPDGNPWFTTNSNNMIGEYNVSANSLTYYYPPSVYGNDYALTTGPDGNVWAVDSSRDVDVYILNILSVSPTSITLTGGGQQQTLTVTEPGTTSWTATSSNPAVATVAPGGQGNQFVVTSVAHGSTKVIVSDAKGNSFAVHVTVI